MKIISVLLQHIPGTLIERLYNSKIGRPLVFLYELSNKGENVRTYRIFDKILMEIDVSKPAERAIPFGAYEPVLSSRFMDQLNQGATVLDIGSWIGYYALLAACDSGLVIAIEADETNCARINRNIELNHFSNVKVLNVAVGDGEYSGSLIKGPSPAMNKVGMSDRSSLQVRKLDNIIEELKLRKIHLLMMDIEGFEYRAINGLSLSLSKGVVEKIFCEVHPGMLAQDGSSDKLLIDKLENFGYSIEIIDKNKSAKSKPYHIQATLKR